MRELSNKNTVRVSTDPPLTLSNTLIAWNQPRSPLGIGYQSPDPARFPMSMAKIVDTKPPFLSTVSGVHTTTTTARRKGDATSLEISN